MSLAVIDIALRAATVALLLMLAVAFLRDCAQALAARLAIALAFGSAAHAVTNSIGATSAASVWHALLIALSTANVVVFWLFARAVR